MIVVVDDEERENEGDLTMAAERVTPEAVNFMITHARGLLCLAMTPDRLDALEIPLAGHRQLVAARNPDVRPDRRQGRSATGVSAPERAMTIRAAIDPATTAARPASSRATCSRCGRATAASSSGPATPRRPSIWPGSPASPRPA